MKATQLLHDLGQSLWLDNITRDILENGTLKRYIDELSVTGLTSNPTIFDHAIKNSTAYDAAIRKKVGEGKSGEALFFELAIEDLTRAADLFRPIWDLTNGVDGWVSLEVSPLLAYDTASTLAAAKSLHARAGRPNLLIKIPGTREGLPAIEEAIFAGIPINVTLLFSREQYVAAAEAYMRGIDRRIAAGLNPQIGSGGLALREPVGRRGGAARSRCAEESPRHRHRQAHLQGGPRALRLDGMAACLQLRRPPAAAAVGEHGDEGSQGLRRPLREGARLALHRQHHAGGHPEGARRPRPDQRDRCPRTAATARRCWRSSGRRASTSTPSPPSSRRRGRSPS